MTPHYQPPEQSGGGQFFDAMVVLVLVYAALLAPVVLGLTQSAIGGEADVTAENLTWESLGQNAAMQAQWEKLGLSLEEAAAIINSRFDYTIEPLPLILTAVIIFGYVFFLIWASDREYREVIDEKFGGD